MQIEKLNIDKSKFDINLKFYFFLKNLTKVSLNEKQCHIILENYSLYNKVPCNERVHHLRDLFQSDLKLNPDKQKIVFDILDLIQENFELDLLVLSLKLYLIKDLLLHEAKIKSTFDASKLCNLHPLSMEYDCLTVMIPYSRRVSGALLSLIFFDKLENKQTNFISKDAEEYILSLSELVISLKHKGLEPNQIFMLMFTESVNQSIISDSGNNYEDRILSVLINLGLKKEQIHKVHDKNDASTEFDFFFDLDNRTYGIGAKRTLRERYKQFIKTSHTSQIDVMIEITIGLDLNEEKAKTIVMHGTTLFVSDEIYQSRSFLQNLEGVYSVKDLTLSTLKKL